jgi:hypothetical protein
MHVASVVDPVLVKPVMAFAGLIFAFKDKEKLFGVLRLYQEDYLLDGGFGGDVYGDPFRVLLAVDDEFYRFHGIEIFWFLNDGLLFGLSAYLLFDVSASKKRGFLQEAGTEVLTCEQIEL